MLPEYRKLPEFKRLRRELGRTEQFKNGRHRPLTAEQWEKAYEIDNFREAQIFIRKCLRENENPEWTKLKKQFSELTQSPLNTWYNSDDNYGDLNLVERSWLYDAVKKAGMYKSDGSREYTDEYKAYRASGLCENGVSIKEMEDDF